MRKNGFTLIELLVVVTIISVLSFVGITNYQGIQAKTRDSIRKTDLNKLALALEIYAQQNNGSYISSSETSACQTNAATSYFYSQIKDNMSDQKVPTDPSTSQAYCYISTDGSSYRLFAKFEKCSSSGGNLCGNNYNYTVYSDNLLPAAAPGETVSTPAPTATATLLPSQTPSATSTSNPVAISPQVTLLGKLVGSTKDVDTELSIPIFNNGFQSVTGTDLGAATLFKNKLYFTLGDTLVNGVYPGTTTGSFFVPYSQQISSTNFDLGITLAGYLPNGSAQKALNSTDWTIPNALFTISYAVGITPPQEYMFGQYMAAKEASGNDHHAYYSYIAKYNESSNKFDPYKSTIYRWGDGTGNGHFIFGMASFVPDTGSGYLYMIGSPTGRFGGVKLARISIASFVNATNTENFQYYLGGGNWSGSTNDVSTINQAVWLIPPKDSGWSLTKDYADDNCSLVTIAEFSVVFNPYLNKYILITGRPCSSSQGGGVYYYTADNITGPWSSDQLLVSSLIRGHEWEQYGTYTTPGLLSGNGQTMYFTATTWYNNYTVYLYKATF